MTTDNSIPATPLWFTIICIIVALPATTVPQLLALCNPELKSMVWLYPVYVVASCYLAWKTYPQRSLLAWILIILTIMGHVAIWLMVTQPTENIF